MEHPLLLTVISGFLGYVAFLMVSSSLVKRRANPYGLSPLPGIGGDFLIGNLRQNPVDTPWLRFTELYKSHGTLISVSTMG